MLFFNYYQIRSFVASLLLTAVFLFVPSTVIAAEVNLEWDKNSEPDVAGYKVYYRQAHEDYDYDNPAWAGSANQCVIPNLEEDTNYYFIVRAFTYSGHESEDSTEAEYDYEYSYELDTNFDIGFELEANNYTPIAGGPGVGGSGDGCFIGSAMNYN